MRLEGAIPPLTTPFESGRVSLARLRENIERYEAAGVHGYLLLGSSGEAALLDEEEKIRLLRAARSAVPGTKPLVAGIGLESTTATVRLARAAADCGADLLLVLTPHYFDGQMDGSALEAHYMAVADVSRLPLLLYNVPKFTHVQIPTETVVALSRHERIAGIKDSSGSLEWLAELMPGVADGFSIVCGSQDVFVAALSRGARAGILAAAEPFPSTYVRIYRLAQDGETEAAEALLREVSAASRLAVSNLGVPGIKAAMDLCGLYGGLPRPPLRPVSAEARGELGRAIEALRESGALGSAP